MYYTNKIHATNVKNSITRPQFCSSAHFNIIFSASVWHRYGLVMASLWPRDGFVMASLWLRQFNLPPCSLDKLICLPFHIFSQCPITPHLRIWCGEGRRRTGCARWCAEPKLWVHKLFQNPIKGTHNFSINRGVHVLSVFSMLFYES